MNLKGWNRNKLHASPAMDYLGNSLFLGLPQFWISDESVSGKVAQAFHMGSHRAFGVPTMERPYSTAASAGSLLITLS